MAVSGENGITPYILGRKMNQLFIDNYIVGSGIATGLF